MADNLLIVTINLITKITTKKVFDFKKKRLRGGGGIKLEMQKILIFVMKQKHSCKCQNQDLM